VGDLEEGDLDLVIGGLTAETPWSEKAGTSRPYTTSTDEQGATVEHVMLVPRGENRFLIELDAFLLGSDGLR
jgi:hypothetical protein